MEIQMFDPAMVMVEEKITYISGPNREVGVTPSMEIKKRYGRK